ncbi:MAG TPA: ABC transporter ATP-binding protein [Puia sp.]|nr:ABC transporter ATP-binding protein [Puia sp.]
MSTPVIKIENISKQFVIAHEAQEKYTTLRDTMARKARKLFSFPGSSRKNNPHETFWALRDISFDIHAGDRVGIIGRNGAGKSTLLKILSRITEPSSGRISLRGRVASLLEVGTGFHPELTGRENIFLNGAILGMARAEIRKKFDEIVAFAETEKFLDTPVKRYSSGMHVRLAFAVAAHLEPEILIVDEVLAVGDAQFQKKCLGKMEEVSKNEGRTVLFVSHSMPTISSLCNRAILLEGGRISIDGETSEAVLSYYTSGVASPTQIDYSQQTKMPGDSYVRLHKVCILANKVPASQEIDIDQEIDVVIDYSILEDDNRLLPYPNIHVYNAAGVCVFISAPSTTQAHAKGDYTAVCRIPANFLNQGSYFIGIAISSFGKGVIVHLFEQNALSFNIKDNIYNVPTRLQVDGNVAYSGEVPGTVRPLLHWQTTKAL